MSRNRLICLALVACLVLPVASFAVPTGSVDKGLTVGDFAVMVASRVSDDSARPVPQPEAAATLLAKSGIRIKSDLSSPLTEAEAADLLGQFGITLQVSHPADLMDRGKAVALVDTFSETLAAKSSGNRTVGASSSGPGSSLITLDTTLPECQNLATVKECKSCCLALGYPKKTCNQSCGNSPKASATEPTP